MRANHLQQTKAQWYDRNPLTDGMAFDTGTIAPHASTTRVTYTVPANRNAMYEYGTAWAVRMTAAGAPLLYESFVFATLSGGGNAICPDARSLINTAGNEVLVNATPQAVLLAGQTLNVGDLDLSAGGTCRFFGAFKFTEYDAQ